jgi:hypothetical protein
VCDLASSTVASGWAALSWFGEGGGRRRVRKRDLLAASPRPFASNDFRERRGRIDGSRIADRVAALLIYDLRQRAGGANYLHLRVI